MVQQISRFDDCDKSLLSLSKSCFFVVLSIASTISGGLTTAVVAQVIPDNTLPNNSLVLPNGDITEINGGTTLGNNLFHSFEQFSLSTGDTAWFNNAVDIENILGRVTGNTISNIDGLIRANGTANLFFINPQGIVFGENASLDIGGSFFASTADSLKFVDGSEFSAIAPQESPLLTVSIPIGLQYGGSQGDIVIEGIGNQLRFNPDFTVNRQLRPDGLKVNPGETLALLGGNIWLDGGNLTAQEGKVVLGSVAGDGFVGLNEVDSAWDFDYSTVSGFQNINLFNASSLEVSGNGGGDVHLQGREVIIVDGSAILADNFGDRDGGTLQINASETLVVAGTTADQESFISRLSTDVAPGVRGNGGNIELNSGLLVVADGAQVISSSYGSGDTGDIRVTTSDLELISGSPIAFASGLFTLVLDSGNGGAVEIAADNVFVLDGAEAAALTFWEGAGGNLNVRANVVEVAGTSPNGFSSRLSTNTEGFGAGGDLNIDSRYLRVADGGAVQSSTFVSGQGGNITVRATEVELLGGAPGVGASGLFANVEFDAEGNGGSISIEAESLLVADGAQLAVSNFGIGHAGDISVQAGAMELIGTSPNGFSGGLFSNVEPGATGNGGNLSINVESLSILDSAEIAVTTFGEGSGGQIALNTNNLNLASGGQILALTQDLGQGGNIQIKASEIELTGTSDSAPSGFQSTVAFGAQGNGGSLSIETDRLQIKDGAQIAVSTAWIGNGGELKILANEIAVIGGSEFGASGIFANAIRGTGNGGSLNINAHRLAILDGATISASNFSSRETVEPGKGSAGNINIQANSLNLDSSNSQFASEINASANDGGGGEIVLNVSESITLDNRSQIVAKTSGSGDGGNIAIATQNFNLSNQGKVSVDSFGSGQAGNIELNASQRIDSNNGSITAISQTSGGGDISLSTNFLALENNSLISTSVNDSTGGGGNLTINSPYIVAQDNSDLRANAFLGQGGNIDINTEVILLSLDSEVDASSEFGLDGVVEIQSPTTNERIGVVRFSEEVKDPTALISAICPIEVDNAMVTTGKGGLAENPSQALRSQSLWEDLRDFSLNNSNIASQDTKILEAAGLQIDSQGNLELVSQVAFNQCRK